MSSLLPLLMVGEQDRAPGCNAADGVLKTRDGAAEVGPAGIRVPVFY